MKRAGKVHIWRGSADQTADAWGTISRSMNGRDRRSCSTQSPSDGPSWPDAMSARAARWKRTTSASMRWNHGVARCARFANRPLADVLAYSKSPRSSLTANDMFDGCQGTSIARSSFSKFG